MAGFRTFATGEVLTAANVNNFLMKQSVMVFADAAARTAALGSEVVEGMLTYNEDTAQLEVFDGSAFVLAAPAPPAGIGSNVVQTIKTDTFTTSSATYVPITDLSATITPTSATSKVLIVAQLSISAGEHGSVRFTGGNSATYIGDADGLRTRVAGGVGTNSTSNLNTQLMAFGVTLVFADSPASASAVTYALEAREEGAGAFFLNRTVDNDSNATRTMRGTSSLTVIEVAA